MNTFTTTASKIHKINYGHFQQLLMKKIKARTPVQINGKTAAFKYVIHLVVPV